jgi:WD40 repeat protein
MPIEQSAIRAHGSFGLTTLRAILVLWLGLCAALAAMAQAPLSKPELVLQTGHTGAVNAIALSSDGRILISASDDNTLKIWDTATGNVLRTLYGHAQAVLAAVISPDDRLLASGGEDMSVRVWDVATGEARVFGQHNSPVKEVAFSGDGRQLVSLGSYEVKVWDVASGREIRSTRFGDDKEIARAQMVSGPSARLDQTATALTADGRLAAVGGGLTYKSGVLGVGGGLRQKPIRIIETASGREIESFKLKGDVPVPNDLSFSPDGRLLAAKFTERSAARHQIMQSSIVVFDVTTGREVKSFATGDAGGTGGIAFSPDGRLLASRISATALDQAKAAGPASLGALPSGSIKLLDVATWQEVRELNKTGIDLDLAHGLTATPLRFSNDGKIIAASLSAGIALYDSASGNPLRVLRTTEKTSAVSTGADSQASRDEMLRQAGVDPDELRQMREMTAGILGPNSPLGEAAASAIGTGSTVKFSHLHFDCGAELSGGA